MENLIVPLQSNMPYKKGYKYQLSDTVSFFIPSLIPYAPLNTEYYHLKKDGSLHIRVGYAWDGASGPTLDTSSSMRGSLVHDILYQMMRNGHIPLSYRDLADSILKEQNIIDGMWVWRANLWTLGLNKFGGKNILPSHRKRTFYAP